MDQAQMIVDVYLLLVREDQILLGRRTNTGYGDGAYEPVCGRLAERETIVEAAQRLARDRAGLKVAPGAVWLAHVMHDVSGSGRIAFFLGIDSWRGEPGDPSEDYSDLTWFPLDDLPANMIDRARVALRNYSQGTRMSTYPAFGKLEPLWISSSPMVRGTRFSSRPSRPLICRRPMPLSAPSVTGMPGPAAGTACTSTTATRRGSSTRMARRRSSAGTG
jgi:8-oxo-dGTP diphosphatase